MVVVASSSGVHSGFWYVFKNVEHASTLKSFIFQELQVSKQIWKQTKLLDANFSKPSTFLSIFF